MTVELNPKYTLSLSDFPEVDSALEEALCLTEMMTVAMSYVEVTFNLDDDDDDDDDCTNEFRLRVSKSMYALHYDVSLYIEDERGKSINFDIDLRGNTIEVCNKSIDMDHPLFHAIQSKCKQSLKEHMDDWVKENF